ncbi:ROK family protein [Mariprofundus sp. EBB-1]|uniref:ROK family protein n=1 Tax=Mariprofundus sp. EBB-1 TaxID=2650971 RepID=UPI000EF237BF|nr:ROK family protein [Mariprofundus sp. EBB-1]
MRIGIDLGGSKIELIALDHHDREHMRIRRPTPAGDYKATIALIVAMVSEATSSLQAECSIGIGTPGAVSLSTGRMKNCNSTCLNSQPLQQDLERALQRKIRLSNDANCFALSETIHGAAQGARVVFGVILGTGVGGGLVINGQIIDGANHIAGEWGHNPLPLSTATDFPGPACYCGRHGCIESWLSGPAMAACHQRDTGDFLSAEAIAHAAASGDIDCTETLERYFQRVAMALATVINIVDPDVIVLGGGLSNIDALYRRVPELWLPYIFSDDVRTTLLPPEHGDSSGVYGAAWLWEKT